MADEKYLKLVRSLLAKAEATDYPAEAEECTRKALALMSKYGIEEAQVRAQNPHAEPMQERIVITNPRAKAKAILLDRVARGMRCESILIHPRRTMAGTMHVFGFPEDVARAKFLYANLLMQMDRGLQRAQVPAWESPRAFRNAWVLGYIDRVGKRLAEARKASEQEATTSDTSVSLVLADQSKAVADRLKEAFPESQKFKARSSSWVGGQAGRDAGARADIGQTRLRGQRSLGA